MRTLTERGDTIRMTYDVMNGLVCRVTPAVSYPKEDCGMFGYPCLYDFPLYPNTANGGLEVSGDTVTFTYDAAGRMVLLTEGLVDAVSVPKAGLRLAVGPDVSQAQRGVLTTSRQGVTAEFSQTEIQNWTHFFLRAFREGRPEVDHLDCEVTEAGERIYFTVVVDGAKEPLSADEARRRLGI